MCRGGRGKPAPRPAGHTERFHPRAGAAALLCLVAGLLAGCGPRLAEKAPAASLTTPKPASAKVEPADNSYCYVCHVNYQEEPLAQQHQLVGIGCEQCHGMSAKHSADEDNLTPPEHMYSEARVAPFCLSCHARAKLAQDANHQAILAASAPQRCTDCHGEHRLKHRTRRWDKDTGKLTGKDSGPVMDRK